MSPRAEDDAQSLNPAVRLAALDRDGEQPRDLARTRDLEQSHVVVAAEAGVQSPDMPACAGWAGFASKLWQQPTAKAAGPNPGATGTWTASS